MAAVDKQIKAWLVQNKHEIAKNLETLTLKQLRKDIATELSIDEAQVKQHKELISKTVDRIVKWAQQRAEKKRAAGGEENNTPETSQVVKKSKGNAGGEHKKPKSKPAATDPQVQQLKDICKDATITIPPALYKRASDTTELVQELESLIGKHGLRRSSGSREIAAVKARLTKERELEGIDMDNIITEPGRRRRTATAAVDYKKMAASSTSDEDSDGDDEDDEDDESDAGSEQQESEQDGEEDDEEEAIDKKPTPATKSHKAKAATPVKTATSSPASKGPRSPHSGSKKKPTPSKKQRPQAESEEDVSQSGGEDEEETSDESSEQSCEEPKQRKPGTKRVVVDSDDA